ncbi:MAG: response regulator transcription factor [Curvibacter sp.]
MAAADLRIVIADDHLLFRAGLTRILSDTPGLQVVGVAGDGSALLALLKRLDCDLLLLDMAMPPPRGPDLIRAVHAVQPHLPILVVSMYDQPAVVQSAIRAGARGYVTKGADPAVLLDAVRHVGRGGHWLDTGMADQLLFRHDHSSPHERLSPRERQVLARLVAGQGNTEIARALYLSEKTISTHKAHILGKLGLTSTADLVRYALEHPLGEELQVSWAK